MAFREEKSDSGKKGVLEPIEEYEDRKARQEAKRKAQGQPHCISNKEEYILWKERQS
jgi:hypothetical protein